MLIIAGSEVDEERLAGIGDRYGIAKRVSPRIAGDQYSGRTRGGALI